MSRFLLTTCLTLLLCPAAFSAEYLIRLEFVSVSYDEETDIEQLLSTIEFKPLEVKISEGEEFEVQQIEGKQLMSFKGKLASVEDGKLHFPLLNVDEKSEHRGHSHTSSRTIGLDEVQYIMGFGHEELLIWGLVIAWEEPTDEKALASKRKKFAEDRIDFVRKRMLEQRQEAFAKEKAAASLLALAQKHFADGESDVALLLLNSFSFDGTEVEEQAAQLRRSLQLQD